MTLLHLDDVKKHFGAQEVLRGASLRIDPGDKVGLVGRNGGGKTTILRLIEGLEHADWGGITLRKGAKLGHVPQRPQFDAGVSVRAYVECGLEETRRALRELDDVNHRMTDASGVDLERSMKEHDRLSHVVESLGGWETERKVETVLRGIGLKPELWDREACTLSGGEKSRTALARELVAGGDLLLLDEPTNHLDLAGIEWIEAWIREMKSAVLIVSHDRRLLDNAVSAIFELERGEITRWPGNYSTYVRLKEERFVSELRAWETQQDFIRKEEQFIRKHTGSQRTAEAKGRQKKLENIVRLPQPWNDVRRPVIRPPIAERGGELVLETRDLSGGYSASSPLFRGVDLRIARGERIGIVGRNGAGKTTLLRILAGSMAPLGGRIDYGHKAACGYFDQETTELRIDGSPYSEIRRDHPELTDLEIRSHLARFLFRGNDVDASVDSLSGGERARLCLARLVLTQPSWLAMDEPTNHLDLAARTALEEMLGEYQGAIVCISHDRQFLDGLCNRILEVDGGTVTSTAGNYSDWRARKLAELEVAQAQKSTAKPEARPAPKPVAKRQATVAAGATAASGDATRKKKKPIPGKIRNPYMFEKLEKRIIALEEELAALQSSCVTEDVYRNAAKLRDTQMRIAEVERDLAQANEEWANWD